MLNVSPNLPLAAGTPHQRLQPAAANLPANGFVLLGPPNITPKVPGGEEFAPAGGVWANIVTPGNSGWPHDEYGSGLHVRPPTRNNTAYASQEFKRHIVLLQRLANPYLQFNAATNPYITVDVMDFVPSFDAVHRGKNDGPNRKARSAAMNPNGYDPINDPTTTNNRFSIGKVQPYAGHSVTTAVPSSNRGHLQPVPVRESRGCYSEFDGADAEPHESPRRRVTPRSTFGQHNGINAAQPAASTRTSPVRSPIERPSNGGTRTLMTPYDWYVQMDRPLINQIELFQVCDTPPYRVTDQFITFNSTLAASNGSLPGVAYGTGHARWRYVDDGLARALEYLTVKPYTSSVPHGGRLPGQINLNVVQDQRVIQGLFDPQTGNSFDTNFVNNTVWSQWMASRTPLQQFYQPNGYPAQSSGRCLRRACTTPTVPTSRSCRSVLRRLRRVGSLRLHRQSATSGTDSTILRRIRAWPTPARGHISTRTRAARPPHRRSTRRPPRWPELHAGRAGAEDPEQHDHRQPHLPRVPDDRLLQRGYRKRAAERRWRDDDSASWVRSRSSRCPATCGRSTSRSSTCRTWRWTATTNKQATVQPFFTSVEAYRTAPGRLRSSIVDTGTAGVIAADGTTVTIQPNQFLVLGYGVEQQVVQVSSVAVGQTTLNGLPLTAPCGAGRVCRTCGPVTPDRREVPSTTHSRNTRPSYPTSSDSDDDVNSL